MKLKVLSLVMALLMIFAVAGCGNNEIPVDTGSQSEETSSTDTSPLSDGKGKFINPLTGVVGLNESAVGQRPVAIMVNNISFAKGVQAGICDADIVYEAYAEGGITRLLAVFKDYTKISKVGSIRSARFPYVDLALGHDAVYIHAGINESYCTPYVAKTGIDNINMNSGAASKYAQRISNGLASEHTLYTTGELIGKCLTDLDRRKELKKDEALWQKFAPEESPITLTDGAAKEISVKMSAASTTKFVYDDATQKYVRYDGSAQMKDYFDKDVMAFKNVLVLDTDLQTLEWGIIDTKLIGGEGWYFSQGTYQKIKWSKGDATNSFKFTLADGSELTLNAGNTWVCLHDKSQAMTFDGAQ